MNPKLNILEEPLIALINEDNIDPIDYTFKLEAVEFLDFTTFLFQTIYT